MIKNAQDVVVRPVMTERSTALTQSQNVITLEVLPAANKIEIRNAVETLFKVKVAAVGPEEGLREARRRAEATGDLRGGLSHAG